MRLKHLDLQGFKTFASKSEFVFPTGVTAIVGPNGSGKSNIADAIRWVLGEQSFSVLRGKRTEDMIFAGSESRPRAGLAQVSLTLDNSDGWLPVEFTEVVVGRRASRDGQNEYFLNGSRVRLRDITELLSQSGLARRTYAVIGQGLVDQALSLRPEERRALFEEAAGIGLYQSKREESLRKLDETQRNLERARDILAEISPRLRSLQRQAERSQQFERLNGELRDLQRTWYGYHWARAQEALRDARAIADAQSAQLGQQQAQLNALTYKLAGVREQQSALRVELTTWQRQANKLRAQVEATRRELAVLGERDRLLEAQQAEVEASSAALQTQRAEQAERLAQAQARLGTLRQQAADHVAHIAQTRQSLQERRAERERLAARRAEAQRRIFQLAGQVGDRRNRRAQLAERRAEIQRDMAARHQERTQLEEELARQRQTIEQIERDVAALNERQEALREQGQACAAQIAASQHRQSALEQSLAQARAAETELRARLDALGKVRDELEGYSAGVQMVMNARIPGVRGPLATLINAPPEWERAIEAALGQDVQALVIDTWTAAQAARERLGEQGRATLILLDLIEERARQRADAPKPNRWQRLLARLGQLTISRFTLHISRLTFQLPRLTFSAPDAALSFPSSSIYLADAVTCEPALRPVIEALLGRTILAADLETAHAIAHALKPGEQVVTPEEDVLTDRGTALLGQVGAGGLLTREREWRELPAQLALAEKHSAEIQAQLDREAAQQLKLMNQQTALAQAAEELNNQSRQRSSERDTLARAAERLGEQIKWEGERINQLESDLGGVQSKEAALEAELQTLAAQQSAEEENIRACEAQLGELSLEELEAQLASLQTAAAVTEQAIRGQEAVLSGEQSALAKLDAQLGSWAGRTAQLAHERFGLSAQIESLRLNDHRGAGELDQIEARIHPAEAQLDQLEQARTTTETEESAARARIRDHEARHNTALLEASRREDDIAALRERIDEDLGLMELEMAEDVSGPLPLPLRPIVEELPVVNAIPEGLEDSIRRRKAALHRLGPINAEAQTEYQETFERHTFLTTQCADLEQAITSLHQVIAELDELMRKSFLKTFEAIAQEFKGTFTQLFGGGSAKIVLTDPDNLTATGIDIVARPPGKRQQGLALLSGGERALTAAALLFSIIKVRPTPFCVLDEVDAALDEANVTRFRDILKELSSTTQFVLITHNRGTIEAADTIYGITMGADHASRVLSYRLDGQELQSSSKIVT